MVLACDPPRHAMLLHLGPRQQPPGLEIRQLTWERPDLQFLDPPRLEVALQQRDGAPCLVALHLVRHCWRLPFVTPDDAASLSGLDAWGLNVWAEHDPGRYAMRWSSGDDADLAWSPLPGLTLPCRLPTEAEWQRAGTWRRVVPLGFEVDLHLLRLELHPFEFRIDIGVDTLKDVSAALFCRRTKP